MRSLVSPAEKASKPAEPKPKKTLTVKEPRRLSHDETKREGESLMRRMGQTGRGAHLAIPSRRRDPRPEEREQTKGLIASYESPADEMIQETRSLFSRLAGLV